MEFFNTSDLLSLKRFESFDSIPIEYLKHNWIFNVCNFFYIYKIDREKSNFHLLFDQSLPIDLNKLTFTKVFTKLQRELIKRTLKIFDVNLQNLLLPKNLEGISEERKKEIFDFLNIRKPNIKFTKININEINNIWMISHNLNCENVYIVSFDDNGNHLIGTQKILDKNNVEISFYEDEKFSGYVYVFGMDDEIDNRKVDITIGNQVGEIVYIAGSVDLITNNEQYKNLYICDGSMKDSQSNYQLYNTIGYNYAQGEDFNEKLIESLGLSYDVFPVCDADETDEVILSGSDWQSSWYYWNAFRKHDNFYWATISLPAFITASFKDSSKKYYIYKYKFATTSSGLPVTWQIQGYDKKNESWNIIDFRTSQTLTKSTTYTYYSNHIQQNKYSSIKFYIEQSSTTSLGISNLNYFSLDDQVINNKNKYLSHPNLFRVPNIEIKNKLVPCIYYQ